MTSLGTWLTPASDGIYCPPGDFWIDPGNPQARALITHGHADHARGGHGRVVATPETLAIMTARYGPQPGGLAVGYGHTVTVGEVRATFYPAGHVLGSAQILLEYNGERIVVSGDYKRSPDPTCPPFVPVPCDVFITEATFALPVFHHPPVEKEIGKLLEARASAPERCVLVGAYALGKAQRLIALLRQAGYDRPIYLHGALLPLTRLYEKLGVQLGDVQPMAGLPKAALKGEIILCPPSALADRWSRRLPEPITALASGWMRLRQRARQRNVELPLVLSDHADWGELTATIEELGPAEVWVTHGREEALVHWCERKGISARALLLHGREDEEE